MEQSDSGIRIVGIGASAGGIRALEEFFAAIPPNLGVAYVVIQHLSPDHESILPEILQRQTTMKVTSLQEPTVPQADHVYVKPPQWEVAVSEGLQITPRPKRDFSDSTAYLPIDDFFFSLAKARGASSVGIILSGMGTDGSRGLREVKQQGGLVMVQAPDSAQFNGMPKAATRQGIADVIMPPRGLAKRLTSYIRRGGILTRNGDKLSSLNHEQLVVALLEDIREATTHDFSHYRVATINRRIEKRMLFNEITELEDYVALVRKNEEELRNLRNSFLIGVTRFFRDKEAFDVLREFVVPRLVNQTSEADTIRIWVPACSTGEEAYSIVIMLENYLREHNLERSYKIFASDVDKRAVEFANRGCYDETIVADVTPSDLNTYFTKLPDGYRILPELKENMLFAVQNLLEDPPFIHIDLLSCRNFLIYVDSPAQQRILANFHFALANEGFLLLGPSESLGTLKSAFQSVNSRWKLFQKRGSRSLPPSFNQKIKFSTKSLTKVEGKVPPVTSPSTTSIAPREPAPKMDYFSRYLSERYAPSCLFVNANYDIVYLSGDFAGLLRLPRYDARLSLNTVVSEKVKSLLTAGVDRVFETEKPGIFERVNLAVSEGEDRWVKVRFGLEYFTQLQEKIAYLEIVPLDESEKNAGEQEVFSPDSTLRQKVANLEMELGQSEQRAAKLYNELETANEELQSSNRELLASNEEMQSTNEELQSVNEELYTVNNELQLKNEELNNINSDISNLLKGTQISTIFVDADLNIRRFTPGIKRQFDLSSADLGRPIAAFSTPFNNFNIEEHASKVAKTKQRYEAEIIDREGNYYLVRILPYRFEEGDRIGGVVITFVDINDIVQTRKRLRDLAIKYEAIFNNTEEVISIIRESGKLIEANKPFLGYPQEDIEGVYLTDLIDSDQEKVDFANLLRATFDDRQSSTCRIKLRTKRGSLVYARLQLIPIMADANDDHEQVEQAMVIVQDISLEEREKRATVMMLEEFRQALAESRRQGGLMDPNGNIIEVNRTHDGKQDTGQYLDKNVRDFLSESGRKAFDAAIDEIKAGSTLETVNYKKSDVTGEQPPVTVEYRPVFSRGRLVLISIVNVSEDLSIDP